MEAGGLFRRALSTFGTLHEEEHGPARAMLGIALALLGQGRTEEAESYYERTVPALKKRLGDDHRITLQAMHEWALGRQYLGLFDDRTEAYAAK